jgi:predicted GIY-YIG superfamily endonuclease
MKSVYLIRGNDGKYKIGIAKHPIQRIKQLQTGNSEQLKLIEIYQSENARKIESALHNRYSYVKNIGEWFDLSVTEEVNFIQICKNIDDSINYLKKMDNIFI